MSDIINARKQNVIQDFSTYNFAANIPLVGEQRFFNNVKSDVQNILSVMGTGAAQADTRPFLEPVIIHATGNVDLTDIEISGNRVIIYNTTGATIEIDIDLSDNIQLPTGCVIQMYYNGSAWRVVDTFIFHITGNFNLEFLRLTGTKVLIWNATAGTLTVNLNTAAAPYNIDLLSYNLLYLYFDGNDWRNIGGHVFDSNYLGKAYMLPESDRPAAWVLGGGNAVAPNWTDVDFSAYVPEDDYLTGLILLGMLSFDGDNAQDTQYACIRQNGSAEVDDFKTRMIINGYSNLAAGTTLKTSSIFPVLCDTSAIIEYIVSDAVAGLSLTVLGYYKESRL
jgi:hypothetical protein